MNKVYLLLVITFLIFSCKQSDSSKKSLNCNGDTLLINGNLYCLDSISESEYKSISYRFPTKSDTATINKSVITITNDFIRIKTGINTVEFKNDTSSGESFSRYSYVKTLINVGFVLISRKLLESTVEILVNLKNGKKTTLWGKPRFSPNNKMIISYNVDLVAGFSHNGFQLFEINNGDIKQVFEREILDWGTEEIKWDSDTSIVIKRIKLDSEHEEYFDYRRMIIKN
jgi:hypothetical protein